MTDDLDFRQRAKALEVAGDWFRGRSSSPADVVKGAYVFLHFLRGTKPKAPSKPVDEAEAFRGELRAMGVGPGALPAHLDRPVADLTVEDKREIREWARNASVQEMMGYERPKPVLREVPKPAPKRARRGGSKYAPELVAAIRRDVAELRQGTGSTPKGAMKRLSEKYGIPRATLYAIVDGRLGGPVEGTAA